MSVRLPRVYLPLYLSSVTMCDTGKEVLNYVMSSNFSDRRGDILWLLQLRLAPDVAWDLVPQGPARAGGALLKAQPHSLLTGVHTPLGGWPRHSWYNWDTCKSGRGHQLERTLALRGCPGQSRVCSAHTLCQNLARTSPLASASGHSTPSR